MAWLCSTYVIIIVTREQRFVSSNIHTHALIPWTSSWSKTLYNIRIFSVWLYLRKLPFKTKNMFRYHRRKLLTYGSASFLLKFQLNRQYLEVDPKWLSYRVLIWHAYQFAYPLTTYRYSLTTMLMNHCVTTNFVQCVHIHVAEEKN